MSYYTSPSGTKYKAGDGFGYKIVGKSGSQNIFIGTGNLTNNTTSFKNADNRGYRSQQEKDELIMDACSYIIIFLFVLWVWLVLEDSFK